MILFTILLLTLAFLVIFTVVTISAVGAAGIVVFGDVIVCVGIIIAIMAAIFRKKKK